MKTELETAKELKDEFKNHYEAAADIIEQPKVSQTNVDFFSRQKQWCEDFYHRFTKLYEDLRKESIECRVMRAVHGVHSIDLLTDIIDMLIEKRQILIRKKEEEERKKLEEELKKREAEENKRLEAEKAKEKKQQKKVKHAL